MTTAAIFNFKIVYISVFVLTLVCFFAALYFSLGTPTPSEVAFIANAWHGFFGCLGFLIGGFLGSVR